MKRKRTTYESRSDRPFKAKRTPVRANPSRVVPGYTRSSGAYRRSLPGSPEKKFFDTAESIGTIATTGLIVPSTADNAFRYVGTILNIPQGTSDNARVGNKIQVKNINIRLGFSMDDQTTGALLSQNIRVILFVDKQANGAAPTPGDLLDPMSVTTGAITLYSWRNMDNIDRFQILSDKFYHLQLTGTNALHTDAGNQKWWKINKKCNIPITYSSTLGALTEFKSNNVAMLMIGDASGLNCQYTSRVKYYDA